MTDVFVVVLLGIDGIPLSKGILEVQIPGLILIHERLRGGLLLLQIELGVLVDFIALILGPLVVGLDLVKLVLTHRVLGLLAVTSRLRCVLFCARLTLGDVLRLLLFLHPLLTRSLLSGILHLPLLGKSVIPGSYCVNGVTNAALAGVSGASHLLPCRQRNTG